MKSRKKKWLIGIAAVMGLLVIALLVVGHEMAKRFEPYVREQAVNYLQHRFDSEVDVGALHISMPHLSPFQLLFSKGHGGLARVEGENIVLRHKGRRDIAPMFVMKQLAFEVDLGTVFASPKRVQLVVIHGMEINIPPKGERPQFGDNGGDDDDSVSMNIILDEVQIHDSVLAILPGDPTKKPLRFDLHNVRLESAGKNVAMKYNASLTNAKPQGEIMSTGNLGPWAADEPGDTPLNGDYVFDKADLGVFDGIAGILHSTGTFEGTLDAISARGTATVPDFRLKQSGNPVPLKTKFEVLVDGTKGNTILKPVVGTLGKTTFTTSGAVIKHEADNHRTINLDVDMPKGNLRDLLTLAMKGKSFMEGQITLKTKIKIPPLSGKVKEKLMLDGQFEITNGKFLRSKIQDHIDTLSRRGQGQPKNLEIDEVVLGMAGTFNMENQKITFENLSFAVPGSGVDLAGSYDLEQDDLDFHGTLKLDAKVSETMTGWKRWLAKPLDPFFSKDGAGTLLHIQVVGSSKEPKFGRDKGPKDNEN
jgi:AsmA-like C-terminal region